MNWKTWLPLALALLLGLIAAKVGRDMLLRSRANGAGTGRMVQVVVAKHEIPPGQDLQAADLMLLGISANTMPPGMFATPAELAGRVTTTPIGERQPIMESLLAPVGSGVGLQALVPPGMRAMTIDVNESSGVAGLLTPGSRVDVLSSIQDEQLHQMTVKTIVENARVTAVGPRLTLPRNPDEAQLFKSVTLLVTPQEAERLELACATGRPRLVLRSSRDTDVRVSEATAQPQHPAPPSATLTVAPLPATRPVAVDLLPRSVQVIRAGSASTVTFGTGSANAGSATSGANLDPFVPSFPHNP